MKLLFWDRNGFWLLYMRVEQGTYERLQPSEGERLALTRVGCRCYRTESRWRKETNGGTSPMSFVSMSVRTKTRMPKADDLPDDVAALKAMIAQRDGRIAAQQLVIEKLQKIAFGKEGEQRPRGPLAEDAIGQGPLFHAELIAEAERTAKAKQVQGDITLEVPKRKSPRKGRRTKFPSHLPQVATRYELEDDARSCGRCGGALHENGEEVTRELERLETAIVHEIRRAKYACRGCEEGVTTAPGPDRVIEKGLLGPGYLAHVAVERFGNHMPYAGSKRSMHPKASRCRAACWSGRCARSRTSYDPFETEYWRGS